MQSFRCKVWAILLLTLSMMVLLFFINLKCHIVILKFLIKSYFTRMHDTSVHHFPIFITIIISLSIIKKVIFYVTDLIYNVNIVSGECSIAQPQITKLLKPTSHRYPADDVSVGRIYIRRRHGCFSFWDVNNEKTEWIQEIH